MNLIKSIKNIPKSNLIGEFSASQSKLEIFEMLKKMTENDNNPAIVINACISQNLEMDSLIKSLECYGNISKIIYVPILQNIGTCTSTFKNSQI